MDQIIEKITDLGIGIISSIIGGIILAILGISYVIKIKRKSKLTIKESKVKGDIVQGDKKKYKHTSQKSLNEKRTSDILITNTEVGGDIVQGDKEI